MSSYNSQAEGLKNFKKKSFSFSNKSICCLAIASGKGGVGKTFISVNLAMAFAKMKKNVLLIDADLGLANADIILGVQPEYTIQDIIFKGKEFEQAVVKTKHGVDLISASSGSKELLNLGEARMGMFIKQLISFASNYDVLMFDCAAGIDGNVTSFLSAVPQSLIVATPQPTSIMDVYALIKVSSQEELNTNLSLIVNQTEFEEQGLKVAQVLEKATQQYLGKDLELLGSIENSAKVRQAIRARRPVLDMFEDDIVSERIRLIAKKIIQKQESKINLDDLNTGAIVKGMLNND